MEKLEAKIEDIEYAIESIDTTINILKKYEQFKSEVEDLKIYKSALELDLDGFKIEYEELEEQEGKEARIENKEQEKAYWKEVI